jgi:hypothetical protein
MSATAVASCVYRSTEIEAGNREEGGRAMGHPRLMSNTVDADNLVLRRGLGKLMYFFHESSDGSC